MIWILSALAVVGAIRVFYLARVFWIGIEAGYQARLAAKIGAAVNVISMMSDGNAMKAADIAYFATKMLQVRAGITPMCLRCGVPTKEENVAGKGNT